MTTIGHHTCKKDGGEEFVLENAPFLSVFNVEKKLIPFLGIGYYFWDYDLELAKKWGANHCNNSFFVVQGDLNIPDNIYLDLAGNRQNMAYFLKLLNRFAKKGINAQRWKIGAFIEFLKQANKHDPNIFPFEIIRAEDYVAPKAVYQYLFNDLPNYTNLSPRFVICFFTINDVFLKNKEIVHIS